MDSENACNGKSFRFEKKNIMRRKVCVLYFHTTMQPGGANCVMIAFDDARKQNVKDTKFFLHYVGAISSRFMEKKYFGEGWKLFAVLNGRSKSLRSLRRKCHSNVFGKLKKL